MKNNNKFNISSVFVLSMILPMAEVDAAGFSIPELSVEGVAMSDAMVANDRLEGAFAYNYASMVNREKDVISLEFIGVALDTGVAPLAPNAETGSINNQAQDAVIPAFYLTHKMTDRYSLGFHLAVPFGLESIWPSNTFTQFASVDTAVSAAGEVAGLHPLKSGLELFTLSPSLGIKISDQLAIAFGIDYYVINKVEFNTLGSQTRGDGHEPGWNISAQYKNNNWTAGMSYHSAVDIGLKGTTDVTGMGLIYAKSELGLPYRLQLGVGYNINDDLYVEFDIERVGWSQYDEVVLEATGGVLAAGTVYSVSSSHWDNVNNYRAGLSYRLDQQNLVLLGMAYEQAAQGDDYFDATIADADKFMLSLGVVHKYGSEWLLKAGYQYAWIDDRRVDGQSYLGKIIASGGLDSDANGTDAYNGQYTGHIQMLAIGVSRLF